MKRQFERWSKLEGRQFFSGVSNFDWVSFTFSFVLVCVACIMTIMENFADVSEPQITPKQKKRSISEIFQSIFSNLNGNNCCFPLKWMWTTEQWIYWSFCSLDGPWGSEMSTKFSILALWQCLAFGVVESIRFVHKLRWGAGSLQEFEVKKPREKITAAKLPQELDCHHSFYLRPLNTLVIFFCLGNILFVPPRRIVRVSPCIVNKCIAQYTSKSILMNRQ